MVDTDSVISVPGEPTVIAVSGIPDVVPPSADLPTFNPSLRFSDLCLEIERGRTSHVERILDALKVGPEIEVVSVNSRDEDGNTPLLIGKYKL